MPKKFSKRQWTVMNRRKKAQQALKYNAPVRGRKISLQEKNREILDRLEAELDAQESAKEGAQVNSAPSASSSAS